MAHRRRRGRRSVIDPSVVLRSVSTLLSELEYLSFSDLRDIQNYTSRLDAITRVLRRLPSSLLAHSFIDQVIHGLDEIKSHLAEMERQSVPQRRGRGYIASRVYTGMLAKQHHPKLMMP